MNPPESHICRRACPPRNSVARRSRADFRGLVRRYALFPRSLASRGAIRRAGAQCPAVHNRRDSFRRGLSQASCCVAAARGVGLTLPCDSRRLGGHECIAFEPGEGCSCRAWPGNEAHAGRSGSVVPSTEPGPSQICRRTWCGQVLRMSDTWECRSGRAPRLRWSLSGAWRVLVGDGLAPGPVPIRPSSGDVPRERVIAAVRTGRPERRR